MTTFRTSGSLAPSTLWLMRRSSSESRAPSSDSPKNWFESTSANSSEVAAYFSFALMTSGFSTLRRRIASSRVSELSEKPCLMGRKSLMRRTVCTRCLMCVLSPSAMLPSCPAILALQCSSWAFSSAARVQRSLSTILIGLRPYRERMQRRHIRKPSRSSRYFTCWPL